VIRPNQGATTIVDGQHQTLVFGQENLTTKKGTLTISFRGVSIPVSNINPAKGRSRQRIRHQACPERQRSPQRLEGRRPLGARWYSKREQHRVGRLREPMISSPLSAVLNDPPSSTAPADFRSSLLETA
jgi:hypothetical protein